MRPSRLLLASNNRGKLVELRALLPAWVEVRTAGELGVVMPEETGATFVDNALLKARAGLAQTGLPTLADDSGLEVEALGGRPGVRSARFAGEPSNDQANNRRLLELLQGVPPALRRARFRSVVAVAAPGEVEFVTEGTIAGRIIEAPRGEGGFGYDPLFLPSDSTRTMAELSAEEKNAISHRAQAFRLAAPRLISLLEACGSAESRIESTQE